MQTYKPDFICFNQIIVELKAVKELAPEHKAQVINYLKATGMKLGLLVTLAPTRKQLSSAWPFKLLEPRKVRKQRRATSICRFAGADANFAQYIESGNEPNCIL